MNLIPNTYVSVFRGYTTDSFGDEVDSDTPLHENLPVSLIEGRPRQVESETSGTPRVIRQATLRATSTTDIERLDRIKDENTGEFWRVEVVARIGNPAYGQDLRVDLSM